jgi:hypothetical protein
MLQGVLRSSICYLIFTTSTALALTCPDPPKTVNREVANDLQLAIGALWKLKAVEITNKTEIVPKSIYERVAAPEQLLITEHSIAMFCGLLKDSKMTDQEKLDRFDAFQIRLLQQYNKPNLNYNSSTISAANTLPAKILQPAAQASSPSASSKKNAPTRSNFKADESLNKGIVGAQATLAAADNSQLIDTANLRRNYIEDLISRFRKIAVSTKLGDCDGPAEKVEQRNQARTLHSEIKSLNEIAPIETVTAFVNANSFSSSISVVNCNPSRSDSKNFGESVARIGLLSKAEHKLNCGVASVQLKALARFKIDYAEEIKQYWSGTLSSDSSKLFLRHIKGLATAIATEDFSDVTSSTSVSANQVGFYVSYATDLVNLYCESN